MLVSRKNTAGIVWAKFRVKDKYLCNILRVSMDFLHGYWDALDKVLIVSVSPSNEVVWSNSDGVLVRDQGRQLPTRNDAPSKPLGLE